MRSWFVAMPGENLACIGCHEPRSHGTGSGSTTDPPAPPTPPPPVAAPPEAVVPADPPPAAVLLKKAAGIPKGSGEPNTNKVGKVNRAQLEEIRRGRKES